MALMVASCLAHRSEGDFLRSGFAAPLIPIDAIKAVDAKPEEPKAPELADRYPGLEHRPALWQSDRERSIGKGAVGSIRDHALANATPAQPRHSFPVFRGRACGMFLPYFIAQKGFNECFLFRSLIMQVDFDVPAVDVAAF
jgi:hypothetical protein